MSPTHEPLTTEEIAKLAAWLADVEREQPPGNKVAIIAVAAVARLLATIRARDEEIARMRADNAILDLRPSVA